MKSKTQINKKMKRKTNTNLVETIYLAKKNDMIELADALSVPKRQLLSLNLEDINKSNSKAIIVPGKVLGNGSMNKKIQIYALSFSKSAEEKLRKLGCD